MAREERKAAEQREQSGRAIVGRKAIPRKSPYSYPHTYPKTCTERRGLRPRVATRNKWLRIKLLQQKTEFQRRYREAYERRCGGDVDALFPYGSYKLGVQELVLCEPRPPALE